MRTTERKLIDELALKDQFGDVLGMVATSYDLQPEFVETDFLPALLGLGAWDDRSWTSRIQVERHLAGMEPKGNVECGPRTA